MGKQNRSESCQNHIERRREISMANIVAIGEQDFGKIIEYNSFYIDKPAFMKEWWENRDAVH